MLPEQPHKYYFIIRSQRIVLEADSSIQMIMEKLQSYKSRLAFNFEVLDCCFFVNCWFFGYGFEFVSLVVQCD